jgi:hypothetical protein
MQAHPESDKHAALRRIIHDVRRRWRTRRVLNGAAVALALAAITLLVMASIAGRGTPDQQTILLGRLVLAAAVASAVIWFTIRPLLHRVSDERVALYVEEHEPSLKAALLGAVEMTGNEVAQAEISPALIDRLVRTAVEKCNTIDGGRRIERPRLTRSSAVFGSIALAIAVFFMMAPSTVRHGASRLLMPRGKLSATPAVSIAVQPGNDTVPKGADVTIHADLRGFASDSAVVLVKIGSATEYQQWPMAKGEKDSFELVLFDLAQPAEYIVQSEGVRSEVFHLGVADLPYVKTLHLEYEFPAYTGLPRQVVEDGGDIAVPVGTIVHMRMNTTLPVTGGRILFDDARTVLLRREADGTLTGSTRIVADGFYHIELPGPDSSKVVGSPQYTIAALADRAPACPSRSPVATRASPQWTKFSSKRGRMMITVLPTSSSFTP